MSFILKEKKDGSLTLVLGIWFRIMLIIIVILIVAGLAASEEVNSRSWIPVFIILLCVAGSMYEERWVFDRSSDKIEYVSGFMFLNKKRIYKIKDIDYFKLTGDFPAEGDGKLSRIRKKMVKFSVIMSSGKILDIDITSGRREITDLKVKAERIAAYCGIKLET